MIHQKSSKIIRVVVFGPESTGKTTLCKDLSALYKTQWVPEFARSYLQNKWDQKKEVCSKEDLPHIVKGQMYLENQMITKAHKVLFCDTNILVTQIWSETHFDGYCDPAIHQAAKQVHYDLYLLTGIDVPWKKDDLRDRPNDRKNMFSFFENKLITRKLAYKHIRGSRVNRIKSAKKAIDSIFLFNVDSETI